MNKISKGILIIIGNCIGAGILGMPTVCGLTGFIPSTIIMIFIFIYMNISAQIILKANYIFKIDNIIILSGQILNKKIKVITFIVFTFLFISLITAYIAKGGELIHYLIEIIFKKHIKINTCQIILIITTIIITTIKEQFFYQANQIFMILFLFLFVIIIFIFSHYANFNNLNYKIINQSPYIFPILITTFGFHNIIPTIKNYYNNYSKTKQIINIGMIITLIIYIIWNAIILAIMPINTQEEIINNYHKNNIITEFAINNINLNLTHIIINIIAFLAIFTSILGQSISMSVFFLETLKLKKYIKYKIITNLITFIPPLIIININPNIFFIALDFAGGLFALLLFGLLPAIFFMKNKNINISELTLLKTKIFIIITMMMLILFIVLQIIKFI